MPDVQTKDDVNIAYRVIGQGPQDLVLIHGWMVSGAVYDDLIEALDKDAWRLIVVDLRGTGDSDKDADSYQLDDYVEDVRAVVADARVESAGFVGHSMGGQVAQLFAAGYPSKVDRLSLVNTVPAAGMELPDEAHQLFVNSGQDRQAQGAILDMACLDLSASARDRLLDDAQAIEAACIKESYLAWTGADFVARLDDIAAPTLVVASDDPFLPADFLQAAVVDPIADARLTKIAGAGHYTPVERVAETAEVLSAFFGAS